MHELDLPTELYFNFCKGRQTIAGLVLVKRGNIENGEDENTGKMNQKLVASVVIGVIAFVIGGSEAVTCYSCDSRTSSNCLDPFSASGVGICTGPTCTKGWASGSGVTVVIRGCDPTPVGSDLCVDASTSGISAKGCVCRGNLCNDGGTLKPLSKIVVAGMIATIMAITWVNKI